MAGGGTGQLTLPSNPYTDGGPWLPVTAPGDANATDRNYTDMVETITDLVSLYVPATIAVGGRAGAGNDSPYYDTVDTVQLTDPATDLAAVQTRLTTFLAVIDALVPETLFDTYSDNAQVQADSASMFPEDSITTDVATIITNAIAKADEQTDSAVAVALTAATDVITNALAAARSAVVQDEVDELVDSMEEDSRLEFLRGVARFTQGMSDINAVNSSAFIFGLSNMERQRVADVSRFRREIAVKILSDSIASFVNAYGTVVQTNTQDFATLLSTHLGAFTATHAQRQGNRDRMVLEGTGIQAGLMNDKVQAGNVGAQLQSEVSRIKIQAASEYIFDQLKIDEADALWTFQLFQHAGNMLSSASGAAMIPGKLTKGQSAIGGATAGAGIGAKAGLSIGGPVGSGIGAGIGAIIGGIAGFNS